MRLYHGVVRLAGNVKNEAMKDDMSAAEIILLRSIHGSDSVVGLVRGEEVERDHDEERERLSMIYRPEIVVAALGVDGIPLPEKLDKATESALCAKSTQAEQEVEKLVEARLAELLGPEAAPAEDVKAA